MKTKKRVKKKVKKLIKKKSQTQGYFNIICNKKRIKRKIIKTIEQPVYTEPIRKYRYRITCSACGHRDKMSTGETNLSYLLCGGCHKRGTTTYIKFKKLKRNKK